MAYAADWQGAKDKFETDTGLKKPTAKGSVLFVSWRKPTGIEEALKDVDKLLANVKDWSGADSTIFKKWQGLNETLAKKKESYLKVLEDAIKDEKEDSGKSDKYRHLKVLKASLNLVVSQIEQQYHFNLEQWKVRKEKGSKTMDRIDAVLISLRQLGHNMQAGVAQGTKFCKEVLADPTPTNWNRVNTDNGARRLSQPLTNVVKYVYADWAELLVSGKDKEVQVLDDDRVSEQIRKMNIYLASHQKDVMRLGEPSGNSPTNGSIGFLGNDPRSHLPDNATKNEVVAAVKHFAGMLKDASEIANQLARFELKR